MKGSKSKVKHSGMSKVHATYRSYFKAAREFGIVHKLISEKKKLNTGRAQRMMCEIVTTYIENRCITDVLAQRVLNSRDRYRDAVQELSCTRSRSVAA